MLKLKNEQIAFVGDDLPDVDVMKKVGLGVAVANAHELAKEAADYITSQFGGLGAVREVCDLILKSKNLS